MTATVIVGMLCVHLLCFGAMFWLISRRLQGDGLGMDMFALGNAMLGLAYVLQLLGGAPGWSGQSVLNHTLTLCTPLVYAVGGLRFFGRPAPLLRPLLTLALVYTAAQGLAHWLLGPVARYAMLALGMALMFAAMVWALVRVMRGVGRDLRVEMALFALLIAGLGVLNAIKFVRLLQDGLPALDMTLRFQSVFYIYMSFLATVLAPAMIWLVLRRLTDALRAAAEHDPLTQLLNRRGLLAGLEAHFRSRSAGPARLLLLDIDHFKRINDGHGHKAGDLVLQRAAEALRLALRPVQPYRRRGVRRRLLRCQRRGRGPAGRAPARGHRATSSGAAGCEDGAALHRDDRGLAALSRRRRIRPRHAGGRRRALPWQGCRTQPDRVEPGKRRGHRSRRASAGLSRALRAKANGKMRRRA